MKNVYVISIFICSLLSMQSMAPMAYMVGDTNIGQGIKTAGDGIKTAADSIKQMAHNGIVIKAALPQTAETFSKGLVAASDNVSQAFAFSTKQVCSTAESLPTKVAVALNEVVGSVKPSIDQFNATTNNLINNGIQARFIIDPITIKTLCTASIGLALAAAGIVLIYNELTKPHDANLETDKKEIGWKDYFKRIITNRCTIGTAGIMSGLLLIAKSNTIAACA